AVAPLYLCAWQASFFDEISCDALDGRGRPRGGGRGGERSLNTETFGATSVAMNGGGGRRYGGPRGRGSYGGPRGHGSYGGGYS
ncbi:unnamed protein product, partial [Discosporangium mesarthrocarpum]